MRDITILMMMYDFWAYLFRNRKHFFAEFLAGRSWVREVIFCEPPLPYWVLSPEGEKRLAALDPAFCGGFRHRCEGLLSGEQVAQGLCLQVAPKLSVFAPLGLGAPDPQRPLNDCYAPGDWERMSESLRSLLMQRRAGDVLLWIHSPFVPEVIDALPHRWVVYDCTDDYTRLAWLSSDQAEEVRRNDQRVLQKADLVLAVSQQLLQEKQQHTPRVVRLPNGCDFEHFSQVVREGCSVPSDIASISPPVLGYFGRGGVNFKLEYLLVLYLAAQHPEWNFVFIGPYKPSQEELLLPNIHFLGHRPYEDLPRYAAHFDVCLVPHWVNELTRSMDPIKLYEYLATGKPVISTRVAGASELEPAVAVADSWVEFEDAVARALAQGAATGQEERLKCARSASWERRFENLLEYLCDYCFGSKLAVAN
jgi:glycosyltransferase involved in cell wall biosynthesis